MGTPRSRLVVRRCTDPDPRPGSRWETVAELARPGLRHPRPDLRADRRAAIPLRAHQSGLLRDPERHRARDQRRRRALVRASKPVGPPGWLFWRLRPHPSERAPGGEPVWYASAYWKDHGESILLRSPDGRAFERVATIHRGDANDETEIAFLPRADGMPLGAPRRDVPARDYTRLAVRPPDAATLLAFADPPYTEWSRERKLRTP